MFCSVKSKDFAFFEITFEYSIINTQNYFMQCYYKYIPHYKFSCEFVTAALSFSKLFKGVSALKQFVLTFICHLLIAYLHCEHILCPWTPCVTHCKMSLFLFSILEFFLVGFSTNFYCCVAVTECWGILFWVIFPIILGSWLSKYLRNYVNMLVFDSDDGSSSVFPTVTMVLQNYTASDLKKQLFLYSLL